MSEIIDLLRILGPARAVRMKRRYDEAQRYVRGYAATRALWALMNCGLVDRMLEQGEVAVDEFVRERGLDPHVTGSVLRYLDGISLVRLEQGRVRLTDQGRHLVEDTRGHLELTYAYEPLLARLDDMLAGRARLGEELNRRIEFVGRGSGMLCRDLPYPVMADIIARHGVRRVLDLGCGDMALLYFLCEKLPDLTAVGVDIDPDMVAYCHRVLPESPFASRIEVHEADLRRLGDLAERQPLDVDCITAVDTFHEFLWDGPEKVVSILSGLREQFPGALFVIGEFCDQPHEALRKRPTAFLEHHLFHDLTNQRIGDAALWRRVFGQAGFAIQEEKVFNLVGHGYFALRAS